MGINNLQRLLSVSCPSFQFFKTFSFKTVALRSSLEHCPGFIGNKLLAKMTISKQFPLWFAPWSVSCFFSCFHSHLILFSVLLPCWFHLGSHCKLILTPNTYTENLSNYVSLLLLVQCNYSPTHVSLAFSEWNSSRRGPRLLKELSMVPREQWPIFFLIKNQN